MSELRPGDRVALITRRVVVPTGELLDAVETLGTVTVVPSEEHPLSEQRGFEIRFDGDSHAHRIFTNMHQFRKLSLLELLAEAAR
jgi:hypothetical protein